MNRIGIIGSGNSAKYFSKAVKKHKNFDLIAIGSRNLTKAKSLISTHPKKIRVSLIDSVINATDIDTVFVCIPGHAQPNIICKLFENKKNVICEKPLSINYKDSYKVYKAWKKSNKIGLINFCYNFLPSFIYLKKIIKKNELDIQSIDFNWKISSRLKNLNKDNWKYFRKMGGGVLYNYGSHALNLLLPEKSKAVILYKNALVKIKKKILPLKFWINQSDVISNFSIREKYLYNFNLSTVNNPNNGIEIKVCGTKGSIYIDNFGSNGPTTGYKIKKYKNNRNKIKKTIIKIKNNNALKLEDLYYRTIDYFDLIYQKKYKKYNMNINEGLWNTQLLEKLSK